MNIQSARMRKEARAMFWAWCVIIAIRILAWWPQGPSFVRFVSSGGFGFWIGLPLLAAIPLGVEFQSGTVLLLFSQPIDRAGLLLEKRIVTLAAIASTAAAYGFGPAGMFRTPDAAVVAGAWTMIVLSSATFWALIARSIIGGLILSLFQGWAMMFAWQAVSLGFALPPLSESSISLWIVASAAIGYSLLMFALGRRRLARFEATGAPPGRDFLTARPHAAGGPLANLLRSRPRGVAFNLIRKEIRLLRPAWLLMIACIAAVLAIAALHVAGGVSDQKLADAAAISILTIDGLAILLAGALSIGEEKTYGTHSASLSLPISSGLQWLIKLAVIIVGSVTGLVLAIILARVMLGAPFVTNLPGIFGAGGILWLVRPAVVSFTVAFAAFWCACVSKSTVRAALLVFPAAAAVLISYRAGFLLAGALQQAGLWNSLVMRLHPYPLSNSVGEMLNKTTRWAPVWLYVPMFALALAQSYRLFRREGRDSALSVIRNLIPPVFVALACSFSYIVPRVVAFATESQTAEVLRQVSQAVEQLPIDLANVGPSNPRQLTVEDLARNSKSADLLRRWIDARPVTITPRTITRRYFRAGRMQLVTFNHITTVRLENEWNCWIVSSAYFYMGCTSPHGSWGMPTPP